MVPVDYRGVEEELQPLLWEQMLEQLGVKGTAEAMIRAREYFEENVDNEPEDDRPKPLTLAELWEECQRDSDSLGNSQEEGEGEEEELYSEESEEEDNGDV